jgi:hypothetical protein
LKKLEIKDVTIKINKVVRHKTRSDQKNAPIVELGSEQQRNAVLFAAKGIRNERHFGKVYLNADMTVAERACFNELKSERDSKNRKEKDKKFRWAIRR